MKNLFFLIILLSSTLIFSSCSKDEDPEETMEHEHGTEYDYHAHILSPNTDDKHVDDMIDIMVDFESHAGEPVHNVNVRIFNQADSTEIYSFPLESHVHETDGLFEYEDQFELSEANGVTGHTDWVLEAKVWGHEVGEGEVVETVVFHVHP